VATIKVERQVQLKDGLYRPLIDVKGVCCWPNAPDRDQIVDGDQLQDHDLESHWTTWRGGKDHILHAGREFDTVILATSLGPLRTICADLIRKQPKWRRMIDALSLVQTQAVQLWTEPTLEELGWPTNRGRVPVDATPEPLDVWSDMSQLISREQWGRRPPGSIQFLCGPLAGDFSQRPPEDPSVPAAAREAVRATAVEWFTTHGGALWPNAVYPPGSSRLDWSALRAPTGTPGELRLGAQYLRANINPRDL
jgi:uncharacterized protein with NAD-binding domain and iron-sulfur cluster